MAALHPSTNPLRGRTLGGEVGAFEGFSETLSGIWSGFEHGGSPSAQGEDQVTIQAVSQPVSPLRQRMLEDMAMRGLRQETQRNYLRSVRSFAGFLKRLNDTATTE